MFKRQQWIFFFTKALSNIEQKYNFIFKEKQRDAIQAIVEKKDTIVVLPTGYGKTKIYAHLPEIFSSLQSLMLDQVQKLNKIGIKSTIIGQSQKDKSVSSEIMKGESIKLWGINESSYH